jgi:hypothetical protein
MEKGFVTGSAIDIDGDGDALL